MVDRSGGAESERQLAEFLRQVEAWDGTLKEAEALRAGAIGLPDLARPAVTSAENAAQLVRKAYTKRDPHWLLKAVLESHLGWVVGPFLGDPRLGAWPFQDPLTISDDDAARWLPLLGEWAVVDDSIRAFVSTFFRNRRRPIWVPAADALAVLAGRDADSMTTLQAHWSICFPAGLPSRLHDSLAPKNREAFGADKDNAAHLARHTLYAVSAYVARTGRAEPFKGFDPERLAGMQIPRGADASVVLLSLKALLSGSATRGVVIPYLGHRASETKADAQSDDVMREMADLLREDPECAPAVREIEEHLARPGWRDVSDDERIDALWSWLQTGAWFQEAGNLGALMTMRENAGEAATALSARLRDIQEPGPKDPVEDLVKNLRMILDETIYDTTPPVPRSCALAELLLALEEREVADLPWNRLLTRAYPLCTVDSHLSGPVRSVARADLALWMTERGTPPAVLLRDEAMPVEVALGLAASNNGKVAIQVAVQMERLLRESTSARSQVKLLWALLMRNPPGEVFKQLGTILRGTGTPLHEVTQALARFDAVREGVSPSGAAESATTLTDCYADLAKAVGMILNPVEIEAPADGETSARREGCALLSHFAESARRLSNHDPHAVGSVQWIQDFRTFALGSDGGGGLVGWLQWIGVDLPSCEPEWKRLEQAVVSARGAQPVVTPEMIDELKQAGLALRRVFQAPEWPEAVLMDEHLAKLNSWGERLALGAAAIRDQAMLLEKLLDEDKRKEILKFVDPATTPDVDAYYLPPATLRRLHTYLLTPSFPHEHAEVLRNRLRSPRPQEPGRDERHSVLPSLIDAFLCRLLEQRDEARIIGFVRSHENPSTIDPEILRRLHAFLLDSLRLADAERLRRKLPASKEAPDGKAATEVRLPTLPGYLAPFVAAIASGTFLDLEIGKAWNEVLEHGLSFRYWATIGLALLGSFTLLAATLGWRLNPSRDARFSRIRRVAQVSWRALPAFLGALLVSAVVSGVVLWTLEDTHIRKLPHGDPIPFLPHLFLVTSLSLFLGLFLSLVLHRISETSK